MYLSGCCSFLLQVRSDLLKHLREHLRNTLRQSEISRKPLRITCGEAFAYTFARHSMRNFWRRLCGTCGWRSVTGQLQLSQFEVACEKNAASEPSDSWRKNNIEVTDTLACVVTANAGPSAQSFAGATGSGESVTTDGVPFESNSQIAA